MDGKNINIWVWAFCLGATFEDVMKSYSVTGFLYLLFYTIAVFNSCLIASYLIKFYKKVIGDLDKWKNETT